MVSFFNFFPIFCCKVTYLSKYGQEKSVALYETPTFLYQLTTWLIYERLYRTKN